ncbi:MAG: DUF3500 domain-containing protein [Cyclobacteriaceae bacterium]|nr:DUF3500 domain-containing protein [Cyclobacteriaceae bacterium]
MRKSIFSVFFSFFTLSALFSQALYQQANDLIALLSPELQAKILFPFDDPERLSMNFVPMVRMGPSFREFDEKQKAAALLLLKSSLGTEGYRKASDIMRLESILYQLENNDMKMADGSLLRDPLNYHFCIFGVPDAEGRWGWRFEGHHISLSFVASRQAILSSTPSFFGSNPALVDMPGAVPTEALRQETAAGFRLVNSLTSDQLARARFSESAPPEIISGNARKAGPLEPTGIAFRELTAAQKELFLQLLNVYLANYQAGFSESFRSKLERAGLDNLSFAWAGSLAPGRGHYYRIQGPTLLIEYDNIQNKANHVHTVVRDLTNDFAEDLLQAHYHHSH